MINHAGIVWIRLRLTGSAFLLLFVELALIRWLGANIVYLAYFSNFVLIGSFLGIGLGFLWVSKYEFKLFPFAPAVLTAFVIFVRLFDVSIEVGGSDLIFFADQRPVGPPRWVLLCIVFTAVAACTTCIAEGVAREFKKLEPLDAYRWDIVGSIAGIIGFSLLSFLGGSPVIWGLVVAILFLLLLNTGRNWSLITRVITVGILIGVLAIESFGSNRAWSPYYALSWEDRPSGGIIMKINDVATWGQAQVDELSPYRFVYDIRAKKNPGDVLIIGAGSGNDVSVALDQGATHVDAVEIDPGLLKIARDNHPDFPYNDSRVTVHVDDGRAFLERTNQKWDTILLALPDSLTVVLGQGSVRLESYLFTKEAVSAYREHLRPGGTFGMYNFMRHSWLVHRYAATLENEFQQSPCVVDTEARFLSILAIAEDPSSINCPQKNTWSPTMTPPDPVTDDRPFPYLRTSHIPGFYLLTIALILGISVVSVRGVSGPLSGIRRQADVFFMGLAFLLLETKSVVQFALLFGTTWFVNALVFLSILLSVVAAVEISRRFQFRNLKLIYGLLIASLVLNWIVPSSWLLSLTPIFRLAVAGGVTFLPVFLANLIFSDRFRNETQSTLSFGANLLGAVVGGTLEYTALISGYRSLLFLVAGSYTLAYLFSRQNNTVVQNTASS